MTEGSIQVVYVDPETLRQRFNALDYYGAVQRGELVPVVDKDTALKDNTRFPPGTRSQRIFYMQGQVRMAIVHQYLLPNGRLGASGLPDPKWVRDGLRILMLAPSRR
jgi:hypothetical protein